MGLKVNKTHALVDVLLRRRNLHTCHMMLSLLGRASPFELHLSISSMNSLRFARATRAPSRTVKLSHLQTRQFHPTRPTRLVNEVLDASAGLIHGVHSVTGLPWFASIPLTALLVRTAVGLPLQIYTRVNARRERDIAPLIHSWQVYYQNEARKLPPEKQDVALMKKVRNETAAKQNLLRKDWNVASGYKFANLLQLPVWFSLMESLRGMCGNKNGLVPWLLSLVESSDTPAESLHLTVEPTLANEGALWFPDLLAGDPSGVLPALLTLSILMNVRTGWTVTPLLAMADMPKLQMYQATFFRGLRVFIQIMAINVGASAAFYEMPTALLIYWISSTNVATLQTYLLEKYMFMRPPIPTYQKKYIAYKKPGDGDPFKLKLR